MNAVKKETNSNSDAVIRLAGVTKTYQSEAGQYTALRDIDLEIGRGEFVAILGRSGSGKSTLLNMITGIDAPTSGEVHVAKAPLHRMSEDEMAIWRGSNVGIVFQFFQLLPTLNVVDNVILPMDFCDVIPARKRKERALNLLEQVDVSQQAGKLPGALSGGQQQRVAIARALGNDPQILIADEPTGNLDSKTADQIISLFERLTKEGKTILMVTHDQTMANHATREIRLEDGRIV